MLLAYIFDMLGFSPPRVWPKQGEEQNLASLGNNLAPTDGEKKTQKDGEEEEEISFVCFKVEKDQNRFETPLGRK